jgi:hypothetical protein
MHILKLTDSNSFSSFISFDAFYAEPEIAQSLCRNIFSKIFAAEIDSCSFKGVFYTSLNRYFLADIKVLEHHFILKNIIQYCTLNKCSEVKFKIHKKNQEIYDFYSNALQDYNINSSLELHNIKGFWENSLTKENVLFGIKNKLKLFFTVLLQFIFLIINSLINGHKFKYKKIIFWHSFANNKEKIDYKFLNDLEKEGLHVIHPNPYLFRSQTNWNKSIYFLGNYSINPFKYIKTVFNFINFQNKFNNELAEFSDLIPYFPKKWNSSNMTKTFLFMLYNVLENGLVENIAKNKTVTSVNIFRGGAAAGLIYSGMCKKKYDNKRMTTVLVPHGTEFNVIDHFSYFYLDYNILPSQLIKENWEEQLKTKFNQFNSFNNCQLVAGGRIDYELLNTNIIKHKLQKDKIYIGIVLTYNSETYEETYISDIKNSFESVFSKGKCVFIIKPRPNRTFKPGDYMDDNVIIYDKDIYFFLSSIDIIIGTVSTYGILTMVVTDGIYCDIPGLYYLPNSKFNSENLGYSYHSSMESYTYNSKDNLNDFLKKHISFDDLTDTLSRKNNDSKGYLTFNKNANSFLKEFINFNLN